MEQRELGRAIGIIDRNAMPALRDETSNQLLRERVARHDDSRRLSTPEMDEMRLSAPRRPMQGQGWGGPTGPPVYPGNRSSVAVGNQEIGAAQGLAAGQVEGELHNGSRARNGPASRNAGPTGRAHRA